MQSGIDSFAAAISDPATGLRGRNLRASLRQLGAQLAPGEWDRAQGYTEDELSVGRQGGNHRDTGRGIRVHFLPAHSRLGRPRASGSQWQGADRCDAGTTSPHPAPLVAGRRRATTGRSPAPDDRSKSARCRRQWESCNPARTTDLLPGRDRPTQRISLNDEAVNPRSRPAEQFQSEFKNDLLGGWLYFITQKRSTSGDRQRRCFTPVIAGDR